MDCVNPNQLTLSIIALAKKIKAEMHKNYPHIKLTMTQVETLHYIKQNKQVPMNNLSRFLGITPPSVTVLVNRLVDYGFIERKGGGDRRTIMLSLTEKGNEIFIRAKKIWRGIIEKTISRLNAQEKRQLSQIIEKIISDKKHE